MKSRFLMQLLFVLFFSASVACADQADDAYAVAEKAVCQASADVADLDARPWLQIYSQIRLTAIATEKSSENALTTAGEWLAESKVALAAVKAFGNVGDQQAIAYWNNRYVTAMQQSIEWSQASAVQATGASQCAKAALSLLR